MPGGEWPIYTDFNRTEDNFDIFVKGRIDYIDVFDKQQWTTFRYKGRKIGNDWFTEVTNEGNDVDGNNATKNKKTPSLPACCLNGKRILSAVSSRG